MNIKKILFPNFDTKFASKQQRLAKIGTILCLLLSTQISQVWLVTDKIRGRKGQYYKAHIPILTLVLLRGGCTNPPNGYRPGAQNRTAKG